MGTAVKAKCHQSLVFEYAEQPINELKKTATFLERKYRDFLEDGTRFCR